MTGPCVRACPHLKVAEPPIKQVVVEALQQRRRAHAYALLAGAVDERGLRLLHVHQWPNGLDVWMVTGKGRLMQCRIRQGVNMIRSERMQCIGHVWGMSLRTLLQSSHMVVGSQRVEDPVSGSTSTSCFR